MWSSEDHYGTLTSTRWANWIQSMILCICMYCIICTALWYFALTRFRIYVQYIAYMWFVNACRWFGLKYSVAYVYIYVYMHVCLFVCMYYVQYIVMILSMINQLLKKLKQLPSFVLYICMSVCLYVISSSCKKNIQYIVQIWMFS